MLEDEARVIVPISIQILFQKGFAVHQNLAFGLIVKTTEDVQERGLARPALSTQKNHPLAWQGKVKILQCLEIPMVFGPIDLSEIFLFESYSIYAPNKQQIPSSIQLYNIIQIVNLKQISFISKSYPHSLY